MDRRIAYKVGVVMEGVFWLVLLVFSGVIFIFTLVWTSFSSHDYRSRAKWYENTIIDPGFRGIVKNSHYRYYGDLEFYKVLVDGMWDDHPYRTYGHKVLLIQPFNDDKVGDFISYGDSLIKTAHSHKVIIVKQNGERKEGRLVRCSVERESMVFLDKHFQQY